jgi:hypothetical protein
MSAKGFTAMTTSKPKVWTAADVNLSVLDLQGLPADSRASERGQGKADRNGSLDYAAGGEGVGSGSVEMDIGAPGFRAPASPFLV